MKKVFYWHQGEQFVSVLQAEDGSLSIETRIAVEVPPTVAAEMAAAIQTAVFPHLPTQRPTDACYCDLPEDECRAAGHPVAKDEPHPMSGGPVGSSTLKPRSS